MVTPFSNRPLLFVLALGGCLAWSDRVVGRGGDDTPGPAATHSLEEIRLGVARARARLRSLLVEFICERVNPDTGRPDPDPVYNRLAARGVARLWESAHFSVGQSWELAWDRRTVYFTGKTLDAYYPLLGLFETSRQNAQLPYPWKSRTQFYWECFGWWPPDDPTKRAADMPVLFLHEVLTQGNCFVRPRQERVDGAWCHVVEVPGLDKIWIDPAVGFGIRRRQWAGGTPGALYTHYELSDFRELKPGIWIPWQLRRIVYDTAARKPGTPPPIQVEGRATVLRAVVNELPPDLFQFEPPPGTLVEDRDNGRISQVPGGLSFLDTVIQTVIQTGLSPPAGHTISSSSLGTGVLADSTFVALTLGLAMLDLWLLRRLVRPPRRFRSDWGQPASGQEVRSPGALAQNLEGHG